MAKALVNPRSLYRWDAKVLKYRRASDGRFVSQRAIKQAINGYVRRTQREIERLAAEVSAGRLDAAEWQRQTANAVKSMHLSTAAAAHGGWAQMDARAYGRVGQTLRFHYRRLRQFAKALPRMTPTAIRARAGMYGAAGAASHESARRALHTANGYKQERNVLGKAEHCELCVEQTERGWVKIGELVQIGARTCLTRCRCRYEFRK